MTALAQRITQTPMAPYLGVLSSLSREERQIVVAFLTEPTDAAKSSMSDSELEGLTEQQKKFLQLQGFASHTDEEIANDPRLAYILGK